MSTFWLNIEGTKQGSSLQSGSCQSSEVDDGDINNSEGRGKEGKNTATLSSGKIARLVDWNVDVLSRLLKQIIAKNQVMGSPTEIFPSSPGWLRDDSTGRTVLDEVKETIALPPFHARMVKLQDEADRTTLDSEVTQQLKEFVSSVAAMYHDNPFHNFEHASHVGMSVVVSTSQRTTSVPRIF